MAASHVPLHHNHSNLSLPMPFRLLQDHRAAIAALSPSPPPPPPRRSLRDSPPPPIFCRLQANSVMGPDSSLPPDASPHDAVTSEKTHAFASIAFAVTFLCVICAFCSLRHGSRVLPTKSTWGSKFNRIAVARRLLYLGHRSASMCTLADIAILQGETTPLPDGIPSFTVQIINLCSSGCPISDIHVSCGWFASAKLVNPKLFKRVKYNDCIVNDRKPLKGGQSITFEYANSFQYPMAISSAKICH